MKFLKHLFRNKGMILLSVIPIELMFFQATTFLPLIFLLGLNILVLLNIKKEWHHYNYWNDKNWNISGWDIYSCLKYTRGINGYKKINLHL